MTGCCCSPLSSKDSSKDSKSNWQRLCPQNGTPGKPVQLITLKSLLTPTALEQLDSADAYGFCASFNCPVVYFSEQGQTFTTDDLKVPVFQKDFSENIPVCYCFGWTRQRIREEFSQSDKGNVVGIITAHIRAKRCGCEVNNPQGSCCLRNVRLVVEQIVEDMAR